MPRDRRAYLWDMIESAREIQSFVSNKNLRHYQSEPMLRAAVERKLEIIGEALSLALRYFPDLATRISDCAKIVAFRNRLIHGYSLVSNEVVWEVVVSDIPKLQMEVESLLQSEDRKTNQA
jgi:uncharacterized protein with HEPN domain